MSKKNLTYLLASLAVLSILLAIATYFLSTDESPVITVPEGELHYSEGEDRWSLLNKVQAYDKEDGDLSDAVFVNEITPLSDISAEVIYAVVDSKGNTTTARKTIGYETEENRKIREKQEQAEVLVEEEKEVE